MIRKWIRTLRVRREIQRRLDVNLEFDDLDGDAADVRNGARLALVALKNWLDVSDCIIDSVTNWSEPNPEPTEDENRNARSETPLPYISKACVGQKCYFWRHADSIGVEFDRFEGTLVRRKIDAQFWTCMVVVGDRLVRVDAKPVLDY